MTYYRSPELFKVELDVSLHRIFSGSMWRAEPWFFMMRPAFEIKLINNGLVFIGAKMLYNDTLCFVDVEYIPLGENRTQILKDYVELPRTNIYARNEYEKMFSDHWKHEFVLMSDT